MDPYFKNLGQSVLNEWKKRNFSLEAFPQIAVTSLKKAPPSKCVDLEVLIRDFLLNDDQPGQTHSGFGEPELIVFEHPRFYIQILFWLDGTTDIHQHEFSGAFHVMAGSSLHAEFVFDHARNITPYLRTGDLRMKNVEILENGATRPITSGREDIHSLFHLETPSVTVVVRTQNDPGTGPQFTYLPPHIALDPVYSDALTMRRKQLLDLLERTEEDAYAGLVSEMLADLDFERGFYILQNCMGRLKELEAWSPAVKAFKRKHGRMASGVEATIEESARRDVIKDLRAMVTDPNHRFFLALLMNINSCDQLLDLVARRYPGAKPADTVLGWIGELAEPTRDGIAVLDAFFPAKGSIGSHFEEVMADFRKLLHEIPTSGKGHPPKSPDRFRRVIAKSSMRVLMVSGKN